MAQVRSLSDLTDVIADDLARTDLTTAIAQAVDDAIQYYQSERFWFSESRTEEFTTVANQKIYSSSDDDEIPTFISIDHAWYIDSASQAIELERITIGEWEQLADGGGTAGEPFYYAHFNEKIYLYPIPNDAYTIRLTGHQGMIDGADAAGSFGIGATEDGDPNPYLRNAFELLRSHAKMLIYLHKLMRPDLASAMDIAAQRALLALRRETGARAGNGCIVSTQF